MSVRSMDLARTVGLGEDVLDDFPGLDLPPFGDPLFYRIVAMRRFLNEDGEEELAPSFPSEVREMRLIDDVVPPAPSVELRAFTHGLMPRTVPAMMQGFCEDWAERGVDAPLGESSRVVSSRSMRRPSGHDDCAVELSEVPTRVVEGGRGSGRPE